jgi:hypothetical protein
MSIFLTRRRQRCASGWPRTDIRGPHDGGYARCPRREQDRGPGLKALEGLLIGAVGGITPNSPCSGAVPMDEKQEPVCRVPCVVTCKCPGLTLVPLLLALYPPLPMMDPARPKPSARVASRRRTGKEPAHTILLPSLSHIQAPLLAKGLRQAACSRNWGEAVFSGADGVGCRHRVWSLDLAL